MSIERFLAIGVVVALVGRGLATSPDEAVRIEQFEKQVRPVLVEHCQSCHGPKKQMGGLRLDSGDALRRGSDTGPVLAAKPESGKLYQAIHYQGDLKMPPKGALPAPALKALETWLKDGAYWPSSAAGLPTAPSADPGKTHWAFQPIHEPVLPDVRHTEWVRTPVDRFVLAKLESKRLPPSPTAERATLIRRLTLDLHGVPPTPEDVAAFEADARPDAVEHLVDRLLASPRYGERWGRHWLDVARYADTKGYVFQEERRYPFAYTYRDYVVRSFNEDKPFDRFVIEQLAADRLPAGEDRRHLAALGFLTLGRRFLNNQPDIIDDRIDVISRGLLGLTVGCARCHDHKYDPVPMKDYYSLYGVFASSTEPKDLPLIEDAKKTAAVAEFEKELARREAALQQYLDGRKKQLAQTQRAVALAVPGLMPGVLQGVIAAGPNGFDLAPPDRLQRLLNRADRNQIAELRKKIDGLKANSPDAPARAMVIQDLPQPVEPVVFLRGNPGNRGPAVPRQFLAIAAGSERKPFREGSGRLELARAIVDPRNPLTARVFVNRVWQHHFGKGLVASPSDFGVRTEPPSHPELLDWLASRFMAEGWSVKRLHRWIVLSSTYQQRGDDRPEGVASDPENRWLWKFNRQRLDLEALRDSMLFVSGQLDPAIGGPAVDLLKDPYPRRRTLYGFIDRQNLPNLFRAFDFANPDTHAPQRFSTTVPQQALFLMNHPFVVRQAQALAARVRAEGIPSESGRIARMVRLVFGRSPGADELALAEPFIAQAKDPEAKLDAWERFAQVLLLSNEFAFID